VITSSNAGRKTIRKVVRRLSGCRFLRHGTEIKRATGVLEAPWLPIWVDNAAPFGDPAHALVETNLLFSFSPLALDRSSTAQSGKAVGGFHESK
jgi:hypothetical protein